MPRASELFLHDERCAKHGFHLERTRNATYLFGQLLGESLDLALLDPVEDDDLVDLVETGLEFIRVDHLTDDGRNDGGGQRECRGEVGEGQGSIVWRIREEVSAKTLFLDFPGDR
jgi:hypothetical protein